MTKRRDIDKLLSEIDGQLGDVAYMSVAEARQARTAGAVDRVVQTATHIANCHCQIEEHVADVTMYRRDREAPDPERWSWGHTSTIVSTSQEVACISAPRSDGTGGLLMARTDNQRGNSGRDYQEVQDLFLADLETYGVPPEPDVKYEGYRWLVPEERDTIQRDYIHMWDNELSNTRVQHDWSGQRSWRDLPPFQAQRGPVRFTWQDPATREVSYPARVEAALEHLHRAMPDSWALFDGVNREEVNPIQDDHTLSEASIDVVEETYEDSDGNTITVYREDLPPIQGESVVRYIYNEVPDDPLPF